MIRASIDGFHRPRAQRLARGPDSPEGYFPRLVRLRRPPSRASCSRSGQAATAASGAGSSTTWPDEPAVSQIEAAAPDSKSLLFDGVFLLRRELGDVWDFSVFVAAPFAETVRRAKTRDRAIFGSEDEVIRRYGARYVPGQMLYYALEQPQSRADAIVENGDLDRPRLRIRREDGPA